MRVLVFSHGHPEIRFGGAEISAYAHFRALKSVGCDATFVAAASRGDIGHVGPFGLFKGRPDEILWRRGPVDPIRVASLEPDELKYELGELIDRFTPDLAHFHHYFGFSADALGCAARGFGLPTLLTLHEYGAICPHHGQMVTRGGALCTQWSPQACAACVPHSPVDIYLRRERLLKCFADVAWFVAPSHFLAERYADWGLPPDRISVIENILPNRPRQNSILTPCQYEAGTPLKLGYFGQFTPFKGVDVLLRAINLLSKDVSPNVRLTIFGGANNEASRAWFAGLSAELAQAGDRVTLAGTYGNEDAINLMRGVDWIVVPSVWWENSPLVIQEAKLAGIPVLASHIGGMGEKVADGDTGAHFLTGSPQSLAEKIELIYRGEVRAAPTPSDGLAANAERLGALCELYGLLLSPRAAD